MIPLEGKWQSCCDKWYEMVYILVFYSMKINSTLVSNRKLLFVTNKHFVVTNPWLISFWSSRKSNVNWSYVVDGKFLEKKGSNSTAFSLAMKKQARTLEGHVLKITALGPSTASTACPKRSGLSQLMEIQMFPKRTPRDFHCGIVTRHLHHVRSSHFLAQSVRFWISTPSHRFPF